MLCGTCERDPSNPAARKLAKREERRLDQIEQIVTHTSKGLVSIEEAITIRPDLKTTVPALRTLAEACTRYIDVMEVDLLFSMPLP